VPPAGGNPVATSGQLTFYDSELGTNVPAPALTVAIVNGLARFTVSQNGRYIAYLDTASKVHLFDRSTSSEVALPGFTGPGLALSVSNTGLIANDDNNNGPPSLYDAAAHAPVNPNLVPDDATPTNGHRQSHLSGDGHFLATTCLTHCVKTDTGDSDDPDLYVQDLTSSPPHDTAFPDSLAGHAKNDEHPCVNGTGSIVGDDIAVGANNRDIALFDRSSSPVKVVNLPGLNGATDDHDCVLDAGADYVGFYRETVGTRVYERSSGTFLTLPQAIVDTGRIWFSAPYSPSSADTTPPEFLSARLTNRAFSVGGRATRPALHRRGVARGTTFVYELSEAAQVHFKIKQRRHRRKCRAPAMGHRGGCVHYIRRGTFDAAAAAGVNRTHFSGRLGKHTLRPGSYQATLTATDAAGNTSKAVRLGFRIVR
jgi:hypothetical protein